MKTLEELSKEPPITIVNLSFLFRQSVWRLTDEEKKIAKTVDKDFIMRMSLGLLTTKEKMKLIVDKVGLKFHPVNRVIKEG